MTESPKMIDLIDLLNNWEKIPEDFFINNKSQMDIEKLNAIIHDFVIDIDLVETIYDDLFEISKKLNYNTYRMLLLIIGILSRPNLLKILKIKFLDPISKTMIDFLKTDIKLLTMFLAELIPFKKFQEDIDRREEVIRKLARIFNISILGETPDTSDARYLQVDSESFKEIEDQIKVKIQKALEEARQREAAAKANRE